MPAAQRKTIRIMARETGPGPGVYLMPPTVGYEGHDFTRNRNPAYSMGLKTQSLRKFGGPGPTHWIAPGTTRFGPATTNPGYTIAPKLQGFKTFGSPGPAAYSPENSAYGRGTRAPAYTISGRTGFLRKDMTPGPNAYIMPSTIGAKVPNRPTAAAYSITSRRPQISRYPTPGPAAYDSPNLHVYKDRSPGYTMATKTRLAGDRSSKPGPNAYFPMYKSGQRPPDFSFGIKHSEYKAPFKQNECH